VAPRVDDEIDCEFVYPCEATAGDVAIDAGGVVVPLYRQPQWIAVAERLPKEYETVLVATDGAVSAGEIRFPFESEGSKEPWWMVFKDRRDSSPSWAGMVSLNDVTHWMPLPALPADGN
jgi:hypothetical protein